MGYPIRLERWLMEGSYDRVWKAMKKGEVPCEEYGVFSEVSNPFYDGSLAVVFATETRLSLSCFVLLDATLFHSYSMNPH